MTPDNTPTKRFVLKFNSSLGRTARLSIPRARADKTAAEVEATMTEIMNSGAVMFAGRGFPVSIKGAQLVETTRNILF